ncbi:unnamed protein product [Parnassius apollo]|uniref:(apollo) hypothetical protein n=1 Tax=Parnassius apollo TaxID=110799 RepID=A0A8S3Y0K0_PARAO|nr:unnamed protein product [Parnassius apollo]
MVWLIASALGPLLAPCHSEAGRASVAISPPRGADVPQLHLPRVPAFRNLSTPDNKPPAIILDNGHRVTKR